MRRINIGDKVICSEIGVIGRVIKFYVPTACEEQTLVETEDGRRYHAPTRTWAKYKTSLGPDITRVGNGFTSPIIVPRIEPVIAPMAMESIQIRIYDHIATIYKDELIKEIQKSLYSSLGLSSTML